MDRAMLPFNGIVRTLVHLPPWRLMLSLQGLALSRTQLRAQILSDKLQENLKTEEIKEIVESAQTFSVQLEHDYEEMTYPNLRAVLQNVIPVAGGLRFDFGFSDLSDDLNLLVHALESVKS